MPNKTKKRRLSASREDQKSNTNSQNEQVPSSTTEDVPFTNPLIFSCASCRRILADSFSWIGSDSDLRIVAVSRVVSPNVAIGTVTKSSTNNLDTGCYYDISCKGCKVAIGKMYITTSSRYDQFRDMYSLEVEKIDCYECGKDTRLSPPSCNSTMASKEEVDDILVTIHKIEEVILGLHERLEELEKKYG